MVTEIFIRCDGNWDKPEVQFSGSANALASLGLLLNQIKAPIKIETQSLKNEFYPVCLKNLIIEPTSLDNDRLTIKIDENSFTLTGTSPAFNKLGDSLINFFDDDTKIGEHFHLDYYEGNQILNETNCHLIFICDH